MTSTVELKWSGSGGNRKLLNVKPLAAPVAQIRNVKLVSEEIH